MRNFCHFCHLASPKAPTVGSAGHKKIKLQRGIICGTDKGNHPVEARKLSQVFVDVKVTQWL